MQSAISHHVPTKENLFRLGWD